MPLKIPRPTTPGRRNAALPTFDDLTTRKPEKSLLRPLKKHAGRNAQNRITVRHRGGGSKRHYRLIDFKRTKDGIPASVASIEYDPNRTARIALINYADGEKRYILAPVGLRIGAKIESGFNAEVQIGKYPADGYPGLLVHNHFRECSRSVQSRLSGYPVARGPYRSRPGDKSHDADCWVL